MQEAAKSTPPAPVRAPQIAAPLHLDDFAGMQPRADLKDKLLHISGFTQSTPKDGQPATQATEVWLGYTKTAIYFVFICHDDHPGLVRGHLARRENLLTDDNVSVMLDPFQDHRKAIEFWVNPVGVQADSAWTENVGNDFSYDQVWDSEGRVTESGWMAVLAIPFRSLRFRPDGSDWGVAFCRHLPRNSETDFWPRISANVSGLLTQEGTLTGVHGVTGSHNVQINPYTLGQNERTLNSEDPQNPFWSSRHLEGTAGGEVKAILKDSIVFDGTINPDFSDIESDQPQFTVDQRWPVYFPELRPFFLENANYFITPINLIYTRTIVHPEYGGRVTGKIKHTNFGLLAIDDRQPGETVAPGDPLYHQHAKVVVARASQDLGKGSSIGLMYTDEEFGQGWNRIGSIDGTVRFDNHWTAQGQWAESSTMGTVDSGPPPTYSAGPAAHFEIQRSGHSFNMDSAFKSFSTGFQSQLGFIQSADIRSNSTYVGYAFYPKHRTLQSWGLETNINLAFDQQGNRVYHYSNFDVYATLPRNIVFAPIIGQSSDTLSPQNYSTLADYRNFTENYGGLAFRGAPWPQFNFNVNVFRSGNVNYNPVATQAPSLLNQETVQALFTVQPLRQLTADNTYLLDRDHSVANGAFVYESQTFRTKINYQFTRAISARAIVEYDSTLANPGQTSLQRTKQVGTEALLTWLPHPGTAVYIGYNNDMQNLDRALCNRLSSGACDPNNTTPLPRPTQLLNDGRQIFIKASYLFRF